MGLLDLCDLAEAFECLEDFREEAAEECLELLVECLDFNEDLNDDARLRFDFCELVRFDEFRDCEDLTDLKDAFEAFEDDLFCTPSKFLFLGVRVSAESFVIPMSNILRISG